MKSKKRFILLASLVILIIIRLVITHRENAQKITTNEASPHVSLQVSPQETPDSETNEVTLDNNTPHEAITAHTAPLSQLCQSFKERYQNLNEVKKTEPTSVRFLNVHKKINQTIYRLRFFYKDTSETEILTYLLYKENESGEDILIESSPYKKGTNYKKIENSPGEVIYTEEGINVGSEQELFLHFEKGELKDLQGTGPLLPGKNQEKGYVECRF